LNFKKPTFRKYWGTEVADRDDEAIIGAGKRAMARAEAGKEMEWILRRDAPSSSCMRQRPKEEIENVHVRVRESHDKKSNKYKIKNIPEKNRDRSLMIKATNKPYYYSKSMKGREGSMAQR